MKKINCWEFKQCGREPGGAKTDELGVCPAAVCCDANGIHGGKNAGRACWVIANTLCKGESQGTYFCKIGECKKCPFYKLVVEEEGEELKEPIEIIKKMQGK